jgi:branched-chain amino acid transport system ATP-binding protein
MSLLAVEDLRVRYAATGVALHGVSFEVPEGGSVALLGANGAGKTTALRAITGILRFSRGSVIGGEIRFDGRSILGRDADRLVAAGIAQVLEGRRVFAELTVAENLRVGAFTPRSRRRERELRAEQLELFPRLAERLEQRAGLLSGGEQQMLAIARAMMAAPRLLVLDEPSLGLAPQVVAQIGEVLRAIVERGTSVLLVEQSTALALRSTSHAYLLQNGRVRAHAETPALLGDAQVRAAYLGTSVSARASTEATLR